MHEERQTNELFLFLTPHIISSDDDIDKLRNAVQGGSELLKDDQRRAAHRADGRHARAAARYVAHESAGQAARKPDSLTTLRRRPPADSLFLTPAPWR